MNVSKQESPQPNREKSEIVLGSCLVEGDVSAASTARHSRREAFGVSLAIESLVLGLLVAAPLFSSIAQPQLRPVLPTQLTYFHPGPRHEFGDRVTTVVTNHVPPIFNPYQQIVPTHVTEIVQTDDDFIAPSPDADGSGMYIPGGDAIPGGDVTQLMIHDHPAAISRPIQVEKRPVKMSEGVLEAQLINRVEPRYPTIAMQVKKEGTVVLHALISRDGRITSLEVVSGSPLLIGAALEAVQQWRYQPTMLNGEPVEVETTITVVFRLHS